MPNYACPRCGADKPLDSPMSGYVVCCECHHTWTSAPIVRVENLGIYNATLPDGPITAGRAGWVVWELRDGFTRYAYVMLAEHHPKVRTVVLYGGGRAIGLDDNLLPLADFDRATVETAQQAAAIALGMVPVTMNREKEVSHDRI